VLVRICSKAMFFDLSDNNFDFPSEGSYLQHVTEHVHNIRNVVEVDLRNQVDLLGECNAPQHS
jgi:hypothetical protein